MRRHAYDGVVAAAPVTVPYERFSIHGAHWWIGRALHALVAQAGIRPRYIDGLCVSSFTFSIFIGPTPSSMTASKSSLVKK